MEKANSLLHKCNLQLCISRTRNSRPDLHQNEAQVILSSPPVRMTIIRIIKANTYSPLLVCRQTFAK